jgi:hypothetical protein
MKDCDIVPAILRFVPLHANGQVAPLQRETLPGTMKSRGRCVPIASLAGECGKRRAAAGCRMDERSLFGDWRRLVVAATIAGVEEPAEGPVPAR